MKHVNIPIFIPHLGCPNDCVFCNQRKITNTPEFDADSIVPIIESVLETTQGVQREIAFFGGSFTGIDRQLMIKLLEIGQRYVKNGDVSSLRCSTRPDYINDEILDILSFYGMTTVELGIQSTDDKVLRLCKRGHTAQRSMEAMTAVKQRGFKLIGQMMTSLPGATAEAEIETAKNICKCKADGARIYPTVVFKQTALAEMTKKGEYIPPTHEETVLRAKEVKKIFIENNVPVIRLGLQAQDNLTDGGDIYAGLYDPSIGLSVDGAIYFEKIEAELENYTAEVLKNSFVTVYVAKGHTSSAVGVRRENKEKLCGKYGLYRMKVVEEETVFPYEIKIKVVPDTRR